MRSIAATRLFLLTGAWLLSAGGAVNAGEAARLDSPGVILLAEIVVPAQPDSGKKSAKSAAEVRGKARAYQESGSAPTIIVMPEEEEEEGLLGPRRQPDSGASQSRAKARQYQQGATQVPILGTQDPSNPGATNSERAQGNRAKARSYVSTDNTVVIERIGSDGIPIVSCGKLIANVAGRIGDDMQPGGIFFIMRDNKPFKVRCALQ